MCAREREFLVLSFSLEKDSLMVIDGSSFSPRLLVFFFEMVQLESERGRNNGMLSVHAYAVLYGGAACISQHQHQHQL